MTILQSSFIKNPVLVRHSQTLLILRSIIHIGLANLDSQRADNGTQEKEANRPSLAADAASKAVKQDDDTITIVNHKDTVRSFIEKSPLATQFAIIVLFYLAKEYMNSSKSLSSNRTDANISAAILEPFSFTSKEFFDTYSQLALEMGLIKYLVRHIAFAEFMLTLEYLVLIREEESTARYQFKVNFEDLRWMASIALQQIVGGQNLSSPEIFYPSPPRTTRPPDNNTPQPDKTIINPLTQNNTDRTAALVKDIAQSILAKNELEQSGGGTGRSIDDAVRLRSKDYGRYRPYFQHRVPPTQYSFRLPNKDEVKRIYQEFVENQTCIECGEKIVLDYFDVWIGEPLEANTRPEISDQRMTEVLGSITQERSDTTIQETISHDYHPTDRELLSFNYGIIPMDGRDAFIAFAKPKLLCSKCGANPANSVSLMPKY